MTHPFRSSSRYAASPGPLPAPSNAARARRERAPHPADDQVYRHDLGPSALPATELSGKFECRSVALIQLVRISAA